MSVPAQYVSQFQQFVQTEQQYIINNTPPGQPVPTFDPGDPADLLTGAHAAVADMLGQDIYNAQLQAYLSTATGSWLDLKAADYGVYRKQAVAASGTFNFTKNVPAATAITIPQGTLITTIPTPTQPAVQYSTTQTATLQSGQTSVAVPAVCMQAGSVGNLTAGTQLLLASSVPGIDGVNLAANITNGIDEESDDALRARALQSIKGQAFGSPLWYQQQVLTVPGIVGATVQSDPNEPPIVWIYVAGPNNTIPSQTTIQQAQNLFTPDNKPQIDQPTVLAPVALPFNISITVTAAAGADPNTVQQNVEAALTTFANSIPLGALGTVTINGLQQQFSGTIYPSQIGAQAMAQSGVLDYGEVTINGASGPLSLTLSQLPQAGNISVTVNVA